MKFRLICLMLLLILASCASTQSKVESRAKEMCESTQGVPCDCHTTRVGDETTSWLVNCPLLPGGDR